MASVVSKLARAAFATRASPSPFEGIAGGGRPAAAAISGSPADAIPISLAEEFPRKKALPHLPVDENVFKSKEAMWAFYESWCKFYGISRDRREMALRFKRFSATARRVYNCHGGGMAMNHLSDWTKEEIKMLHGRRPAAAAISGSPADAIPISLAEEFPRKKALPHLPFDENVFKSKEAMWAFYESWCKFYGVSRDRREMARRFKRFSATARRVYNCHGGGMAMNHMSDLTKEEIKMRHGLRPRHAS